MLDLSPDPGAENILGMLKWLGKDKLRPLGIECDKKHQALPVDHPFLKEFLSFGVSFGMRALEPDGDGKKGESKGPRRMGRLGILAAEEIAYWDQGVAMCLPGPGLGGPPVMIMGTPEQKKRFFDIFEDKSTPRWGCFALTEPSAGSDAAAIKMTARKDGKHYILNGEKMFITNAVRADWAVTFATVDKSLGRAGHRVFVVEKGTPGYRVGRIEDKMGLKASETASLLYEDCRVPEENLLGGEEHYRGKEGFKGAMGTFDMTRPAVAVMAIGIGRSAYDYARDFVKENYMIHRPIPRYQKIKEKLHRMRRKLDTGRLLCWKAVWMMDTGKSNSVEAAMAKAYCPVAAIEVTRQAMEILGDAGVRNDYFVEKLFRDLKVFDIFEGTGQVQRIVVARRLVGLPGSSG
ncbi:MAG: acyl-CoA dehydrogenase family protein [Nitrospirae bacterium]|nr:acyl-CoA dehydrogenase family protein [Nitrospirota bacterium]